MKKEKTNKYEKGVIIAGIVVALILLILITADVIKNTNKNNIPLALSEQEEIIADATNEPNGPVLSARMIPVKYDGDDLVITTKSDKTWYDYSNEKPAYMMLNDGVYQSELVVDMTGKKLASENIEQVVTEEEQGTIYIWYPRYAYNTEYEIKYVPAETTLVGEWNTPLETFLYAMAGETNPDISLSGIWVEKYQLSNASAVNTKVANMTGENNTYGFIANVKSNAMTSYEREAILDEDTIINALPNSNINRTILKVIEENKYEPIKAKATSDEISGVVEVTVTYKRNEISKIMIKVNGSDNELPITNTNGKITANTEELNLKNGWYTITIVDDKGNSKSISVEVKKDYSKFYGMAVTGYTCPSAGVTTWRVFHIDDDENIYLIADDYVHYNYLPASTGGNKLKLGTNSSDTSYGAKFTTSIESDYAEGSAWIRANTNKQAQKWLSYVNRYSSATGKNIKQTAYMMDTNAWSSFAGEKAEYAIGGPTIELFCASYKVTHPDKYLLYNIESDTKGYYVKWSNSSVSYTTNLDGATEDDYNSIYIKSNNTRARGMHIASPSGISNVMSATNYGAVRSNNWNTQDIGFRPVVCLKSGVKLVSNANNTCSIK